MAFVNEVSEEIGKSRTVDYERDAILREGGGSWYERVPGGYFTITWKEKKIIFSQYETLEIYKEDGSNAKITYRIVTCEYPEELRPYRNEIIQMIKEGLNTFGTYYGKREGTEVEVIIDPSVGSLNPFYNFETQRIESKPV